MPGCALENQLPCFLCGLVLFGNIWAGHKKTNTAWQKSDLLLLFGFPIATFAVLWYLAAVKALFILTSMLFSNVLRVGGAFKGSVKEQDQLMKKRKEEIAQEKKDVLPQIKDRF